MMKTTHSPEDEMTGAPEDPLDLLDPSHRKKRRALSQEALPTQPSTEVEEQTEGTAKKSKKKKKRETRPGDPERVETGEGETGEGELLWKKAKKKVKKKKKIREKEVIEAMTGEIACIEIITICTLYILTFRSSGLLQYMYYLILKIFKQIIYYSCFDLHALYILRVICLVFTHCQ